MSVENRQKVMNKLKQKRILPLYTATTLDYLEVVEQVLVSNDVPLIEVTFRSHLAIDAIRTLSASGRLIVGAGTVRTLEEAQLAIENGAQFIVSPVVVPSIVTYCLEKEILVLPGVATPNDIQSAVDLGLHLVKFFPANIYGGLEAISALSGPFYDIQFLPTGGVNKTNMVDYLNNKQVLAVGGSFILSEEDIAIDDGITANRKLNELLVILSQ